MCGRYVVYSKPQDIARIFSIRQRFDLNQSYNIAPTENVSVIVALEEGERAITTMRWGLIPSWQESKNIGAPLINARSETIDVKPAFRQAIKYRRCLLIADGFYEWKKEGGIKQPYFIHRKDNQPFAMAGIWEKWVGESESIDSCAIITMPPNEGLLAYHDRTPAAIELENFSAWLDRECRDWDKVKELLTAYPIDELDIYPVSTQVNGVKFKGESCIAPLTHFPDSDK